MAAVKIAVTTVDTSGTRGEARIERLGWTIRLGKNSRRGVVRMVTEFFAGFGEQLHARAMAQRRQWEAAVARPGERIRAGFTRDAEFPLEALVVRL